MEQKMDLRIRKTYKALKDTFLELLSEKKFEDITVNELCERAMVRRATFYKHFADKYDFFAFFIREIQEGFIESIEELEVEKDPATYFLYLFRQCVAFLQEHEELLKGVLGSSVFPTILEIFSEEVYCNVLLKMKEYGQMEGKLPVSEEILASFYAGGLIRTLQFWIVNDKPMTEEELICHLEWIFSSIFKDLSAG